VSRETLILFAIAYVSVMGLIFCLLVGAKRSEEAVASYHEPVDGIAQERRRG